MNIAHSPCHVERSETSLAFFPVATRLSRNNPRFFASLRMTMGTLDFLRTDDEMDHPARRRDEEAVEIFAQLFDFVATRDAVNFQK